MAFYADYATTVPYNTSGPRTNAAVTNVIANYLVLYAGFTLVKSAVESTDSSTTNYAEVLRDGLYYRFYGASTIATITMHVALTSGGTGIRSGNLSLNGTTNNDVNVRLRFYNTCTGFLVHYFSNTTFEGLLWGMPCTRCSDDAEKFCSAPGIPSVGTLACVADGLVTAAYFLPTTATVGASDSDGGKQILTPGGLSLTSGAKPIRYILQNVYYATSYVQSGVVLIGTRYFFINDCAVELNP